MTDAPDFNRALLHRGDDAALRRFLAGRLESAVEADLLTVARQEWPEVLRLRVIADATGYGWIVVDHESRRGACVGGEAGIGRDASGVVMANLQEMARQAARELRVALAVPRISEGGEA